MAGLDSVPDNVKWRIAADFSAQIPACYDRAFRSIVGKRYDEIEQEIWMEMAKTAVSLAKNLSLPVGTAQDLAETMRTVMVILFGPEFRSETLEVSKDGSVIIIKYCPLLSAAYDSGSDGERTFGKCMAFTLSSIPLLNRDYSARFVRTMCSGDRQCEFRVARNGPAGTDNITKK
jgi:hypothetical protein